MDRTQDILRLMASLDAMNSRSREFADSLIRQWQQRGTLSDKQWPYVVKLAQDATAPKPAPAPSTPTYREIVRIFASARQHLQRPRIRMMVDGRAMDLKAAADHSRNPGAIYVTLGEDYCGAILPDGTFKAGRSRILPAMASAIDALAADPRKALSQAGQATGVCSLCARTLTDPASIAVGIGPVCATRWSI